MKYKDSDFKSSEEMYFSWWLEELVEIGYILDYKYEPEPIILSEAVNVEYAEVKKRVVNIKKHKLLHEKSYTFDFEILWDLNSEGVFYNSFYGDVRIGKPTLYPFEVGNVIYPRSRVEIKGEWDNSNMTRLFKSNQKTAFDKKGIYVSLTKMPSLFKETFTPKRFLMTDKNVRERVIHWDVVSSSDYIKSQKEMTDDMIDRYRKIFANEKK